MTSIKYFYIVPVLLAGLSGVFLIRLLLPAVPLIVASIILAIPLLILAVGFSIVTRRRVQVIRNQLQQILQTLEEFDVDEPQKVAFESSPFRVFNELNENLIELIDRIRTNYRANKQFTQNASHELQTPLAIIKGHVELLLQSPNMKEKEMKSLAVVLQNTNRLSKLNSALILLSKIQHQRFIDTEVVDFAEVTEEVFGNFKDLIDIQGIEIRKDFQAPFRVDMSATLAEILIANLVQNAIRHNVENGYIEIQITNRDYFISNPGKHLEIAPEVLFRRFRRESDVEESLGLGLSIVKRICEQFGLAVSYVYHNSLHTLRIQKQKGMAES